MKLVDHGFKYDSADECPDVRKHAKQPAGYIARLEWQEKRGKTHDCSRCPTCGYWAIYTKRAKP